MGTTVLSNENCGYYCEFEIGLYQAVPCREGWECSFCDSIRDRIEAAREAGLLDGYKKHQIPIGGTGPLG